MWSHEAGGSRMWLTVAIKQMYAGHSKQAGLIASQCHAGAYANRVVVVVDDDIDPAEDDEDRDDIHDDDEEDEDDDAAVEHVLGERRSF